MPFRNLGIPLSGVYVKVVDYTPLMNRVAATLRAWSGLNLSYTGKMEFINSLIQGIESFWLGILPVSGAVLDRFTCLCRRFLWGSSAKVAWNTMCLKKQHGGLGLRDIKRWNEALLARTLWNIHLKKDSLCCRRMHHIYIYIFSRERSIWTIMQKKNFLPLIKKLLHIRDSLVLNRGSVDDAICLKFNASLAYDFFKPKGHVKPWAKIIWNRTLPPKFSFFFWLAVLGQVPTKNMLYFLGIDTVCSLCSQHEESTQHLFFVCRIAAEVWTAIKTWAGLTHGITTLKSSLKWLMKESRGSSWKCN
ncbi:hypothetical protein M9H77_30018 [Catharanthus roseus]|uniref:Uncharacterized protein n=1 Tax=Catharanthus roseus TaxID=4058 RepID=A0ACB9ZZY8_CATRO|nr:hypothetical protein M9H77_30018 [Catharanthus roseus]